MENFKINTEIKKEGVNENGDSKRNTENISQENGDAVDTKTGSEILAEKLANGGNWEDLYKEAKEKGIRMTNDDIERAHNNLIKQIEERNN